MKILDYRSKYLEQVMELNKNLITTWYKVSEKESTKSMWSRLDVKSRFLHGGPWYDLETLEIHVQSLLKFGHIILCVDSSDELIGMMEFHSIINEIHLDWIMVDPKFQKQGLGSRLLKHLDKQAKKSIDKKIRTEPEDGTDNFYLKNGFKLVDPHYRYEIRQIKYNSNIQHDVSIKEINLKQRFGESQYSNQYLLHLYDTSIKYTQLFGENYPLFQIETDSFDIISRTIPGIPQISSSCLVNSENERLIQQLELYVNNTYFTYQKDLNYKWKLAKLIRNLEKTID